MITSRLLSSVPGIVHGFGGAPELVPSPLAQAWPLRPEKRQVHGRAIAEVSAPNQECGEVDGLSSATAGIPVSVVTADCVPLLLARRDGRRVAALHAGWRGLIGGIVGSLWESLAAQGEKPADWVAAIGPSVGPCCYEVSAELAEQFAGHYPAIPRAELIHGERNLNLQAVAQHELQQAGVGEIDLVAPCTMCSKAEAGHYLFRSYRRGDRGSQQHSGLLILS